MTDLLFKNKGVKYTPGDRMLGVPKYNLSVKSKLLVGSIIFIGFFGFV
jgi:hypothetical protein